MRYLIHRRKHHKVSVLNYLFWDYGELHFATSKGASNDPDNSWDYGELKIFHEV